MLPAQLTQRMLKRQASTGLEKFLSLLFNHPSPFLLTFSDSVEAAKSQMVVGPV